MKDYREIIKQAVAVDSSHIADVSYREKDNTLIVTWKRGKRYEYANVPKEVFDAFLAAPSQGEYFNAYIKGATDSKGNPKYPYTEVL